MNRSFDFYVRKDGVEFVLHFVFDYLYLIESSMEIIDKFMDTTDTTSKFYNACRNNTRFIRIPINTT